MNTKQVIVFRKDLLKGEHAIRKGKFAGQVAHASLGALLKQFKKTSAEDIPELADFYMSYSAQIKKGDVLDSWLNGIFTKVVVSVNTEAELLAIKEAVEEAGIPCALITDCGKTEFNGVPTNTCLGIGPWISEEIDKITGDLPLL